MAAAEIWVTFSVTVNLRLENDKKCVKKNEIRKFKNTDSWFDVFDIVTEDISDDIPPKIDEQFEKRARVVVSSSPGTDNTYSASPYDQVKILTDFDKNLKYVTIDIDCQGLGFTSPAVSDSDTRRNAFQLLMRPTTRTAPKFSVDKPRFSAKDRLYNDLIDDLGLSFPSTLPEDEMRKKVMVLADGLWYIDGSHDKINSRFEQSKGIPHRFAKYTGYNDFRKKRKAAPQLSSVDLKRHVDLLFRLTSISYVQTTWGDVIPDIESLASCLQSYSSLLNKYNDQQKQRQAKPFPVRPLGKYSSVQYSPPCVDMVKPRYSIIDQVVRESDEYLPIYLDDTIHMEETWRNRMQRLRFIEGLSLSHPIDILSYDPGAGLGKTVFLWRVPESRSPIEMMSSATEVFKSLENRLHEYHTREMRREFARKYQGIIDIQPHVLRQLYSDLTMDATSQNSGISARLRQAITNADPDMAIDLRRLNAGRPDDTFSVFFDELERQVSSLSAEDERRHDNVQHFSKYISIRDLIDQTAKTCPEGTPIPSESTVLFAFVPRNAYINTAKLYKGRINLQHKVQTRQLRAAHVDEHYCAAIFSYMKRYACMHKNQTTMVCLDDKAKVDYGEPGMAISTGVRGKKSLVPVTSSLGALDHDVGSKGSLTPSVCLQIDVPDEATDSFYRGQVYVTLKDSIFQSSSPFRHAAELMNILINTYVKPYLLVYTDGGPDHRTTFAAVKLSLIILFKRLDLDILIAARTAPGHSWANPAERIMSLLNIAYQNVAIYRTEMTSHFEQVVKACCSMNDIRKKAEKSDGLEGAWLQSVKEIVNLLNDRAGRVELKGKKFRCPDPVSKEDIQEFESEVQQRIDPTIIPGKYTMNDLKKCQGYKRYIERHCKEGTYIFQVRKCDDPDCCNPLRGPPGLPSFLPDPEINPDNPEHYKPFEDLVGKATTERDMPSAKNTSLARVAEEQQGCPNRLLVAQNVRSIVRCYECNKPRCIYSKKALTLREERSVKRLLERFHYSCGSVITPDGDGLQGVVFVRLQLCCQSPVELSYYSATCTVTREDVCCYCASREETSRDEASLRTHRVVLPMCKTCTDQGKDVIKRLPKKN